MFKIIVLGLISLALGSGEQKKDCSCSQIVSSRVFSWFLSFHGAICRPYLNHYVEKPCFGANDLLFPSGLLFFQRLLNTVPSFPRAPLPLLLTVVPGVDRLKDAWNEANVEVSAVFDALADRRFARQDASSGKRLRSIAKWFSPQSQRGFQSLSDDFYTNYYEALSSVKDIPSWTVDKAAQTRDSAAAAAAAAKDTASDLFQDATGTAQGAAQRAMDAVKGGAQSASDFVSVPGGAVNPLSGWLDYLKGMLSAPASQVAERLRAPQAAEQARAKYQALNAYFQGKTGPVSEVWMDLQKDMRNRNFARDVVEVLHARGVVPEASEDVIAALHEFVGKAADRYDVSSKLDMCLFREGHTCTWVQFAAIWFLKICFQVLYWVPPFVCLFVHSLHANTRRRIASKRARYKERERDLFASWLSHAFLLFLSVEAAGR